MALNGTNGTHKSIVRPLKPGIYAPIPTFFLSDTEDLDVNALEQHIIRTATAGVGPLLAGSMGEAHHLSHAERLTLIKATRRALDGAGLTEIPVIVGTGAGSLRETLQLCNEAAEAGADYGIVITSGYYAGALDKRALKAFYMEVAEKSPIPIIVYNYPGASGGIDIDSDLLIELATECPNLCGVKLTCGNVGKLTRVCATVSDPSFSSLFPRKNPAAPFLVLGGFTDFIVPSAYVNGHGAITGLANVSPYAITRLFALTEQSKTDPSMLPEAQRLQGIIARADYTVAKYSIAGTKYLLDKLYGYGGVPRKPLLGMLDAKKEEIWAHPHIQDLVQLERECAGKTA